MNTTVKNIIAELTSKGIMSNIKVDGLEYGFPDQIVTGVAVTFLATQEVVEKAKDLGINFIISHEGVFYSHWDKREILAEDPVYLEKSRVIQQNEMAVYRFHDYIHLCMPDGITAGLLKALDWQSYEVKNYPAASVVEIPAMDMQEVIGHVKEHLGIQYVRFTGDLKLQCRRIGVLVGYRGGGDVVIPLFEQEKLDLVIYGEGPEWEAPEYVRDAVQQGRNKALLVLGHAESEIPGMKYLADKLKERFPDIPVQLITQKPVFRII